MSLIYKETTIRLKSLFLQSSKKKFVSVYCVLFFFFPLSLLSQKYIEDSLIISFRNIDSITRPAINVDSVIDRRGTDPRLISITEKKQYRYVPVDYFIYTQKPLATEIEYLFITDSNKHCYKLDINEFYIKKRKSLLFPGFYLNAAFGIYYGANSNEKNYLGELLYETRYAKPFLKTSRKTGYEKVLGLWQKRFIKDINNISKEIPDNKTPILENFRVKSNNVRSKNMLISSDFIVGTFGWLIDGEIVFLNREANKKFTKSGYNIRYRNEKDLESIEFRLSNNHLYYRLNNNYILEIKALSMLGFNKWKDLKSTNPKIWDIFLLDISFSQSLMFNPIDKQSIIVGVGFYEGVNYIYKKGVRFQPGLLIQLGFKL